MKIKIRYSHEKLTTLIKLFGRVATTLMEHGNTNQKLHGAILHKLAIKMAKRALNNHDNYDFTYAMDEALAYYICWSNGSIQTSNDWTASVLDLDFITIGQKLSL